MNSTTVLVPTIEVNKVTMATYRIEDDERGPVHIDDVRAVIASNKDLLKRVEILEKCVRGFSREISRSSMIFKLLMIEDMVKEVSERQGLTLDEIKEKVSKMGGATN
mgnify:CR=1 FL=1